MTHLYLIRHGQAISAVQRTLGNTDLSPLGIRQAERLRDRLAATGEIAADVLITSTLRRAHQTAEIIAPALGLPIVLDDDVHERREGQAAGMSEEEYRKTYGNFDFEYEPFHPVAPGGENQGQFMLRVGTALDRVTREHTGKTIVIVCHGGVIEGAFLCFFKMNTLTRPAASFDTHNTSITYWHQQPQEGRPPRWRLIKYNDDLHLRAIDAPQPIPWHEIFARPSVGADQPTVPLETE
ncbi:MAG: histidine phosphatase family protein [Ktedonobacteraceae bacterium]|nr:histidine phosphatase family protein [Ktedonobacteraceae bacterium]